MSRALPASDCSVRRCGIAEIDARRHRWAAGRGRGTGGGSQTRLGIGSASDRRWQSQTDSMLEDSVAVAYMGAGRADAERIDAAHGEEMQCARR